ncbi:NADH dehydrogenase [ubiquinone] flavoprotein 3, mitochondrial isoform X2 [Xiphophorus maculatus]|uniref:NADH dehydrogenase [ubiquinone] flavoprotein 3, mitochondrial isoform X2 n=1 Tax=Xiphophorus maculatus TaxID=8083 RepID=UPI000C6E7B59|nr:NADH dehydrogenase [ubiquinone] flavoprotein 3, mitochondrial isoform X2 [Xiphophorus maculatus]
MAAWLLRSSRLGALKFDSWGTLRHYPPALFCSEAKEPVKPVNNTKDPDKKSAAVPPEPEKSFDNSTYKNYQHHSYTSYTFADLDVEMAKYRLPQPSSGKLSPRH